MKSNAGTTKLSTSEGTKVTKDSASPQSRSKYAEKRLHVQNYQEKVSELLRNVRTSNKSDPFAAQRAMSHIRSGIAYPGDYTFNSIPASVVLQDGSEHHFQRLVQSGIPF